MPAASDEVVIDARPPLTAAVAMTVLPSSNCTLPVAEAGETVTVKVTGCLAVPGLAEEVIPTAVPALFTVWATAPDVAPVWLASPP
jgi:hypothetical protein